MFLLIILAYVIVGFFDFRVIYQNQDKAKLIAYFTLITVSCAISIADVYVKDMPSPAVPIKQFIFAITGK